MKLSINASTNQQHTKTYTRKDSSSLLKLSLSPEKSLSSQFQAQKLSSPAPSSQIFSCSSTHKHLLAPAEHSSSTTIHSHTLLILLTNDSLYSLHILYSRACHGTIMILLHQLRSLSLLSSHTKSSPLFVIMEPMIFTYSFTINGYDVTVSIEFFSHIVILEDSSSELMDNESENIDISLSL